METSTEPSVVQKGFFWDLVQRNPEAAKALKKPLSGLSRKEMSESIEELKAAEAEKEFGEPESDGKAAPEAPKRVNGFSDVGFGMCYKAALYEQIADHKVLANMGEEIAETATALYEHYTSTKEALKREIAESQEVKA